MRSINNPRPQTLEKYYKIMDIWMSNGFNGTEAYLQVYPNASRNTAKKDFYHIKAIPLVKKYVEKARKAAFEEKCIDLIRITEEIADIAFAEKGDEYVPSNVKLKALEILQKSIKEDEARAKGLDKDSIVIGLEEDSNEDSPEEESI